MRSGYKWDELSSAGKWSPSGGSDQDSRMESLQTGRMLPAARLTSEARGGRSRLVSSQKGTDKVGKCLHSPHPLTHKPSLGQRMVPMSGRVGRRLRGREAALLLPRLQLFFSLVLLTPLPKCNFSAPYFKTLRKVIH